MPRNLEIKISSKIITHYILNNETRNVEITFIFPLNLIASFFLYLVAKKVSIKLMSVD